MLEAIASCLPGFMLVFYVAWIEVKDRRRLDHDRARHEAVMAEIRSHFEIADAESRRIKNDCRIDPVIFPGPSVLLTANEVARVRAVLAERDVDPYRGPR